jgi:hypothetical protein
LDGHAHWGKIHDFYVKQPSAPAPNSNSGLFATFEKKWKDAADQSDDEMLGCYCGGKDPKDKAG